MPQENKKLDVQKTLDLLEDPMLVPLARGHHYKAFVTALDNNVEITTSQVDRLLGVCVEELENDKKSIISVLTIIQIILRRIKAGDFKGLRNLLGPILSVLKIIKSSAMMNKMETMQTLCFEILLAYPNETLIEIATLRHSEVQEVLNLYCQLQIPLEVRVLPCKFVLKLLKILPPEKKFVFVNQNLPLWFGKVIPTAIVTISDLSLAGVETLNMKPMEMLESLTEQLVPIDYSDNAEWLALLEHIHNPSNHPALMKKLLTNNSNKWHRLWIMFIKLLKEQITKTTYSQASPINSMLPVVEQAFKMDVPNRCRAFQCWDVLIDNFRTETNESYVVKRLKLLIIPLKSNNAKVEETALAKLNTWWHLIESYQTKLDKFVDKVLISYLHFCFGRHVGMSPKSSMVPGLLSNNTKTECVRAFVDLAGHFHCSCCGIERKMQTKIISKSILVENWNDWVFSLKMAINIYKEDIGVTLEQIQCLWQTFVMTLAEMPDNKLRNDLYTELLSILGNMEEESATNTISAKAVFRLLASLFVHEDAWVLVKLKEEDGPFYKIMKLLLSPQLTTFYKDSDPTDIVLKLRPLSTYILESRGLFRWVLNQPSQQNILLLLAALAESVYEFEYEEIGELVELMLWPFKNTIIFPNEEYATKVWVNMLQYIFPKINLTIKDKLRTAISRDMNQSNTHFKLNLCIAMLNYELANDSVVGCTKNIELLMMLTYKIEDYKYVKDNLMMLTNTVIAVVNKIKDNNFSALLKNTLTIIKNLLKFMTSILDGNDESNKANEELYEKLLRTVEDVVKNKEHSPLMPIIIDELSNCTPHLHRHPSIKNSVLNILKMYVSQSKESRVQNKAKTAIVSLESKVNVDKQDQLPNDDKFTAPDTKPITKKVKKKETTIVNTVVENGEEYEVIKSNWKFNPRKLTENQKEKLQRKREDIPALYQDLSQSQDDFKMSTWKADSQDSSSTQSKSTSNSKSANSGNVSEILKNIPSSDVVPKIIENIFSEKKDVEVSTEKKPVNIAITKSKVANIKDPKSPRLALKDRVFRNVRNLIEKSSVQKDTKDLSESLIQVENMPKTPDSKVIDNTCLVNSAPPNLSTERPARLKRKPKKFDDVQMIELKKSRRSSNLYDSQPDSPTENIVKAENTDSKPETKSVGIEPLPGDKSASDIQIEKQPDQIEKHTDVDSLATTTAKVNQESIKEPAFTSIQEEKVVLNSKCYVTQISPSSENESTSAITLNEHVDCDKDVNTKPAITPELNNDDKESIECTQELLSTSDSGMSTVVEKLSTIKETSQKSNEEAMKTDSENDNKLTENNKSAKTPKQAKKQETIEPRSGRKSSARKSRIEKELAIDTVEGHPFLKIQTEKRITRKNLNNPLNNSRRKSLTDKLNKVKVDPKTPVKLTNSLKKKEKELNSSDHVSVTISESQEQCSEISDDLPYSEDVIESSQDSTFTAISVKSSKPVVKQLIVVAKKIQLESADKTIDIENKDDSILPQNKTAMTDNTEQDITQSMDTLPLDNKLLEEDQHSSDVIFINDDEEPIVISAESQEIANADTQPTDPSPESQEIADADTQPTNPSLELQEIAEADTQPTNPPLESQAIAEADTTSSKLTEITLNNQMKPSENIAEVNEIQISNVIDINTEDEITTTQDEAMDVSINPEDDTVSSPYKDEEQRKKDFLDNTLEISPIKTMSPVRDKKTPSPDTSSDYVLIKLSSPVQSNGEPFEKCDSPEIFTEDKVSPDKRDLSPPREESAVNNTSPSSSLSLKKNRPQVRSGGRAAQMLGLCVPDRLQTLKNCERSEPEDPKKSSPASTPARRNLRILYNSVGVESNENSEENEDSDSFLKFKRTLPTSDCSPSGPILKRKLAEITDDATISPASKRKRVSFHDPPVSTTIAVQKYIEPNGIRSPQNSALKRQERQNLRSQTVLSKSPKRLDNVFKLETVLTKAVESFSETEQNSTDITQSMSLDDTPAVEIVKNSDLNNIDPICPELVDCNDPIDGIAAELSSPTMKSMFLKELEGKITTVGDLAKMTELDINRLCIKAPKVNVAKKVLSDYASKRLVIKQNEQIDTLVIDDALDEESLAEAKPVDKMDIEIQTIDVVTNDTETQTATPSVTIGSMQTDEKIVTHTSSQTNESGAKTTKEVISSCLAENTDFVANLCEQLEESSKRQIAETLPPNSLTDMFMKNVNSANSKAVITQILQRQNGCNSSKEQNASDLLYLQEYLSHRFDNKDLILFCSQLLAKIHGKTS